MNSLKSVCSFAKGTPVAFHQFEQDVEPFLGGQIGVELIVGLIRLFETAELPRDSLHGIDCSTTPRP